MVSALIIIGLLATFTIAIALSASSSVERANTRKQRVVGLPPADSAIQSYLYALRTVKAEERSNFVLDRPAMEDIMQAGLGDRVLDDSEPEVPSDYREARFVYESGVRVGTIPALTMREGIPATPGAYGYWQLYRVEIPNFDLTTTSANLIAYFRAWTGDGTGSATKARLIRVAYRPGRFADFQILTDGPLAFQQGADIDGPVHSNGFQDNIFLRPPLGQPNLRIWANGTITCAPTSVVTTAYGTISMPGCTKIEGNGSYISFLRTEDSFNRIEDDCDDDPNDTVWCFPPIAGAYDVTLQNDRVVIAGLGNFPVSRFAAFLFRDDVRVSGRNRERVTIAARRHDIDSGQSGGAVDAAEIRIVGDVGTERPKRKRNTLGLLAEGDIVVDMDSNGNCPVSEIEAAMVAMSGSLTMPVEWTTQKPQSNPPTCPNALSINGSIAVHRAPILLWAWASPDPDNPLPPAGYTQRQYTWDENLRINTPPYFPLSDLWQESSWKPANVDCLSSREFDTECS